MAAAALLAVAVGVAQPLTTAPALAADGTTGASSTSTTDESSEESDATAGEERAAQRQDGERAAHRRDGRTTDDDAEEDTTGDTDEEQPPGTAADENGETCDKLGYHKFDRSSGDEQDLEFGSMTWGGDTLTYEVADGYTVSFCIKSGAQAGTTTFEVTGAEQDSRTIVQDISHVGWIIVDTTTPDTEEEGTPEGGTGSTPDDAVVGGGETDVEEDTEASAGEVAGEEVLVDGGAEAEIAGVEAFAPRAATGEAVEVRGAAASGPLAAVLPATGSGAMVGLAGLAGLLLLVAGVTLLRRRLRA